MHNETLPRMMMMLPLLLLLIAAPVAVMLTVIPFWKICEKAGFSGALSLLMLIPVANLILPFYLAFADWPALEQDDSELAAAPPRLPPPATDEPSVRMTS